MSKRSGLGKSFKYAFEGVGEAFQNEPNFRIHALIALLALVIGIFVKLDRVEWIILLLTISFVLVTELINTVIEKVVDMASPRISKRAKVAKDVSAAAVLIAALLAIIIGIVLFLPKFF